MIIKRVKKLFKLSALAGIRQGYFLGRNWYELMREPYLTIKDIKDTRDKSQTFLVLSSVFTPLFVYVIARIIYDLIKFKSIILITGKVFELAMIFQAVVLIYLFYWMLIVFLKEKNGKS